MAYHEGEVKAFTNPTADLMCPHSRGQMNRGEILYHWLQGKKQCLIKQQTHKVTALLVLYKCSGIPFGWHGNVCGVPGSKTNGQWQQMVHKVPFQVYAVAFPFCSVLAALRRVLKPRAQQITSNYLC